MRMIEDARADVLELIGDEPWLRSIGIGLVTDEPGIVISVEQDGADAARDILAALKVSVPMRIQVLGQIRKRQ